jgi:hypothetical protein
MAAVTRRFAPAPDLRSLDAVVTGAARAGVDLPPVVLGTPPRRRSTRVAVARRGWTNRSSLRWLARAGSADSFN